MSFTSHNLEDLADEVELAQCSLCSQGRPVLDDTCRDCAQGLLVHHLAEMRDADLLPEDRVDLVNAVTELTMQIAALDHAIANEPGLALEDEDAATAIEEAHLLPCGHDVSEADPDRPDWCKTCRTCDCPDNMVGTARVHLSTCTRTR